MTVEHATPSSRVGVVLVAGTLIVLALAPFWGARETLRLLAEIFTYVALASLWNLLAGYAGLVSVGQQAYVGLGAYAFFYLTSSLGVPTYVGLLLAGPFPAIESENPGPAGFTGSMIVAEFASQADAQAWADADPYVAAGVYARVSVKPFRKTLPAA